ncbi:Aldehyde ferredoxin oxidoreductase [Methanohalobium evestigatum Z-7303]|uniref:Aldehyde ferredoxin oxidoreductase n=1 Tax=Methanohalobium evestigatum (strain ATCC BAA-1072 / DSM 3721 / NBRC 107634 / OCM 161 / Z-7303) TaxID=644295 RepID=D7EBC6_METEZ|nr:aldehyde ferredoxin oxidoreductase family protein [Methanohalobium evestigatum]ADI74643.1 Aldehyde ferredoxin oxidoreductase [Methanohalobium evestigatum Z-7303]
MYGWMGKTITVDLSSSTVTETTTDEKNLRTYIGGRGLGVRILCDLCSPRVNPLSPDNPLIVTTSPLAGTETPLNGMCSITSKSPLTNTIFSAETGGFFGKELKLAGIDALVIKGKAKSPVYLQIEDNHVELKSATHLWNKNTVETTDILHHGGKVACIGKSGENQILLANIVNDYMYSSERGGLGAISGSKNLKAIVVKGSNKPYIFDETEFGKTVVHAGQLLDANPVVSKGLKVYGTSAFMALMNYMNVLPAYNFRYTSFGGIDLLSAEYIKNNYDTEKLSGCSGCPIACKFQTKDNRLIPDYDTIWAFGPAVGNNDFDTIIKACNLCRDYGIDSVSCGSTIASYLELASKNIGSENLLQMIEDIGEGKSKLCNGSSSFMNAIGKDVGMSVKSFELPGYDPRGIQGQALGYATSNHGGCYRDSYMIAPEVLGKPKLLDRQTFSGKAGILQYFQNLIAAINSLSLCNYSVFALDETVLASMLSSVTGVYYTPEDLLRSGERTWNLERLFNNRSGFTVSDDTLPGRFFDDNGIDKNEFEEAVFDYYHFRGWNKKGVPESNKLDELGIDWSVV